MNTTVLRWLALLILFSIAVPRLTSQSVIFSEDFESAGEFNGATTGTSAEGYSWNSACPNCVSAPGDIFQTVNGILRGQDTNGPATFSVNSIDASGCLLVTWQFDYNSSGYSGSGNLECADECPFNGPPFCSGDINDAVSSAECLNCWDFLAWEVSSGSVGDDEVVLGLDCNAAASGSVESTPLCVNQPGADPSNLDLTITMSMWATEEFMEIDNITILCYTEQEANDNGIPIPVECQSPVCDIVIDDVFLTDPSCANTTDGEIEIDASGTGLSGSLEYSITNGSSFQSGNIFSNLGPGTYDIIVQDDNDPGCFATTSVTLTGTVIPNPSTPPPLIICFSIVPPDGEILNLAEIIDEIRNFDPSYTVNFYFDMAGNNVIDLTDPADILALISMMPTTIFATITDGTCESMTVAVSVDLNNYPDPPNGMLEACSTGGDATFTLSDADGQFTGGDPGLSVSYHNTLGNAENGTSPIFTVTTPANLTVFVRVENSAGCASTAELELIVTTVDTPNNASLSVCDDGSGQGVFDLTSVDGNVLGGASGSVIYYENSGLSIEITDPANFTSGPTTVFAVIDNGSGCLSDAAEVTLDLISFDINDAFLTFDPNSGCGMTLVTLELNTPSDPAGDYTFDISYGPISTGVNNSIILTGTTGDANFTLSISETYIFQINSVTGPGPDFCEILLSPPVEYIIEIDDAPDAFPATIIACEDGSGEGFFDLTSLEDIINGNTSNNVTFFQDIDLITPINNPSNYLSAEGTIFAVVESSIGCFSLPVPIQLFLEEIPDPVDINLSTDNACGPTMTVLTFQLPNGDFYDFDLLITDAIGTTVVPLTSVANQSTFEVNVTETTTFSIEEITSEEGCNFTLSPGPSVTISINEPPFAEIILDQAIICNGDNDGAISLDIFGVSPFNVDWSDDDYDDLTTLTGLMAGTYDVTVTDDNGCTITTSITLDEPDQLILDCVANDAGEGNGIGSYTFSYSGGSPIYTLDLSGPTNLNFTENTAGNWDSALLPPGDYTFTLTDQNGCSEVCTFNIPVTCDLSVAIDGFDPNCTDEASGSIELTINSSQPIVNIDWNIDEIDGEANPTGLTEGTYSATVTDQANCSQDISITLTDPAPLILDCNPNSAGEGSGIGSYTFSYSGGTPFYSLELTGPVNIFFTENNPGSWDTAVLMPGDYTFLATDQNGCSESCTFTIPINCDFTVDIEVVNPDCAGEANGSIDLTINSNLPIVTIDWNVDEIDGEANPTGLAAGTYTATIIDQAGCIQEISVLLNDPAPLVLDCHPNGEGEGNGPGSYTFSYSGGTPAYNLDLNGPNSDNFTENNPGSWDTDVLSQGDYIFIITDQNGCSELCAFTVPVNCNFIIEIEGTDPNCAGEASGSIDLTIIDSQPIVSIDWNVDEIDGELNPTGLSEGTYNAIILDQTGCSEEISITLSDPTPLVIDCRANTANEGSGVGSYTFFYSGGTPFYTLNLNGPTNATFTDNAADSWDSAILPSGDYTFTLTDQNGCSESCTFTIPVSCDLAVSIDGTDPGCGNEASGSIDLTISSSASIVTIDWSFDDIDGEMNPTGLIQGTYSVTVTDANNCTTTNSITLTEPVPAYDFSCSVDTPPSDATSSDGSINVIINSGPGGPYTITYDNGMGVSGNIPGMIGSNIISNLPEGDYQITISNGICDVNCDVLLANDACTFDLTIMATDETCAGENDGIITAITSGGQTPYTFLWSNGETTATIDSLPPANYTVTVTDGNNCIATDTIEIFAGEPLPTLATGPGGLICTDSCYRLPLNFTGQAPFVVDYQIDQGMLSTMVQQSFANTLDTLILCPGSEGINPGDFTLTFTHLADAICSDTLTQAINFTYLAPAVEDLNITICPGDSLDVNGQFFFAGNTSGQVLLPGAAMSGCDSIVNVNIDFYPENIADLTSSICAGDTLQIGEQAFYAGNLTGVVTLENADINGCDSMINVTVIETEAVIENINPSICPGDSILIAGVFFSELHPVDTILLEGQADSGCDSLVAVSINILPEPIGNLTLDICPGDSITFNGVVFSEMMLTDTVALDNAASNGCDSLVIVSTNVLPKPIGNLTLEICPGDSVTFNGVVFSEMMLTDTVALDNAASNGCDSLVIVNTNILPEPIGNLTLEICPGDSITFNGVVFSEMMLTDTVALDNAASNGCDSLVIVSTNILPEPIGNLTLEICPGDSITFNGVVFSEMMLTDTVALDNAASNGCDSLVIVNTTVLPEPIGNLTLEICPGDSITFNGVVFSEMMLTDTVALDNAASNGCDSLVIVNTTVLPEPIGNLTLDICPGDSITFNGVVFSEMMLTDTVSLDNAASNGCDSLVIVSTNVLPEPIGNLTLDICPGDSITFNGVVFSEMMLSDTVALDNAASNGCDSLVIVDLNILVEPIGTFTADICPGDSLLLGGEYFHIDRLSDTLRLAAQASNGCDSILQVNLEIADAIVFELLSTLCPGDSLIVGDTTIRDAGQYEVLLMGGAASGCDSIVQVDLMYYPPAVSNFVSVACASDTIQVGDQQFTIDDPGGTVTLAGAASNGCDSLVVVDITFLPNSLNSIDTLLCFGESLLVGGTLFDADNPSGVVFLESSSATGCDSTIFVNTSYQNELFAELSPDITICGDQEATVLLQLTAGDSYAFQIDQTPGSSILETNISSTTYTIDLGAISSSTTLSLSSISAASGCPVTVLNDQSTINYSDSQLTLSSVGGGLNGNDVSCADAFDGAINLSIDNGIGPFTYLWNNGATEANLTGLGAGTYSVTVNDLPGCSTTAEITLNAPSPIEIIATGEAAGCEGTNTGVLLIDTIFGGSGPYEYSLDGQFFSAVDNYPISIANLASGGYTIYVQDANDCQSNLPIGVPNGISLQLELGDDVTISLGDSVLLNPLYDFIPASWNWTPDIDISQPDTFVTYAAPQETTVYQLEMADENGCTTIDQIRIFVENNIDIFIPNAFAPTGSGGNEKLTIYAGKGVESIERFQIFDRWGNQVFGEGPFQPNDPTYGWDGRLNGQIMNAAVFVYYAEVLLTNGKTVVLKGDVMLMR